MANYRAKRRRASTESTDSETRHGTPEEKFLQLARDRFKQAEEADSEQRERELQDLRFFAGDQWPDAIRTARNAQPAVATASGVTPGAPARPCITINKTREPVRQVLNQERQSEMGIQIVPADDFAGLTGPIDETEIELREGLVRRIQRESHAVDARSWAFGRAVIAGRGYYGVMTRYGKGKTFDQDIFTQRFYNQAAVSLDPAHEQPDGSDAEWGFVGADVPWAEYKSQFPSAPKKPNRVSDASKDEFRALGDEYPGWFTAEGDLRSCRVVDYYYTERTSQELAELEDGTVLWLTDVPEGVKPLDVRTVVEKQIKWAKIDATQILEETDWLGPDIPIIKVLGEELQPYDDERRCEGMVRPARESNQGFNYMISKWVETVGLAPIPPLMLANGQDEGFEHEYQTMNTRTLSVLHYNVKDAEGTAVGPPTRPPVDTQIGAIAGSIQLFDEAIQSTMATHDPNVGKTDPTLKSGRAIKALIDRGQLGTSNYLDNLQRSIRYEAQIINNLLYPIYGRKPGRLARIVDGNGEAQTVVVGKPFTMVGGKPQIVDPTQPPMRQGPALMTTGMQTMPGQPGPQMPGQLPGMPPPNGQGQPPQPPPKEYKLTEGAYFNVAIKVTRGFDTRRQEEATTLGELISAEPQLMGWFGDLFFKNQDGPGHQEMAERAKVMLDPKIQAMLAAKQQGADIPPQVQQQLAQSQQLIEVAKGEIDALKKQLETDAIKAQATLEKAKLDAAKDIQLQTMRDATAIRVAQINASTKGIVSMREAEDEALALAQEHSHETSLAASDAGHEERMAQIAQQQALEQGAQGMAGDAALQDQGHLQALEQGQQAADLAPLPEAGV